MSELKPCPFCACEDIDEYEGDFGNGVYCMNCGAMMGEPIHMEFRTNERVTYEQAAEAWNTRTPEQAIAATLGGGKLTAEQVRETTERHWHDLSADYDMPEATALSEFSYDWQAIADELNATLDAGECENANDVMKSGEIGFLCSECGSWDDDPQPRFCHNCGRKVKR